MSGSVQVDREMVTILDTSEEENNNNNDGSKSSHSDTMDDMEVEKKEDDEEDDNDDEDHQDNNNDNNSSNKDNCKDSSGSSSSNGNNSGDDDEEHVETNKGSNKKANNKVKLPKPASEEKEEPEEPVSAMVKHCGELALQSKKEAMEMEEINVPGSDADQQQIQKDWEAFEKTVEKHNLTKRAPAPFKFGSVSTCRDLNMVWKSLKSLVHRAKLDKESEAALLSALNPDHLVLSMENVLMVCQFVAIFHLRKGMEFKHCKGLASMLVSMMGKFCFLFALFICRRCTNC